jgi:hypothetical protein
MASAPRRVALPKGGPGGFDSDQGARRGAEGGARILHVPPARMQARRAPASAASARSAYPSQAAGLQCPRQLARARAGAPVGRPHDAVENVLRPWDEERAIQCPQGGLGHRHYAIHFVTIELPFGRPQGGVTDSDPAASGCAPYPPRSPEIGWPSICRPCAHARPPRHRRGPSRTAHGTGDALCSDLPPAVMCSAIVLCLRVCHCARGSLNVAPGMLPTRTAPSEVDAMAERGCLGQRGRPPRECRRWLRRRCHGSGGV